MKTLRWKEEKKKVYKFPEDRKQNRRCLLRKDDWFLKDKIRNQFYSKTIFK